MRLILASTSPYRRELLTRLSLPFDVIAPNVDEREYPGEQPEELARRLAQEKAEAVALSHPNALVIGSDQVPALGSRILSKPGNYETAREQLTASSGKTVQFYTAVCLRCMDTGLLEQHSEPFQVSFRELDADTIEKYLRKETPYNCAGSFKWEGLGISLFTGLSGNDPTSLQGLPLIALTTMLDRAGYQIYSNITI